MTAAVRNVVVVGASTAGVTVADTLRDEGFTGRITLVGKENKRPYDRPPLSKDVLAGTRDAAATALRRPGHYEDRGIDLRTGRAAVRLAPGARELQLNTGAVLRYDVLVAATGVAPRRLPRRHPIAGIHVLRTLEDLAAFRTDVLATRNVLVVGAGFLGMEVAAACRGLGVGVTVVSPHPVPLFSQLGPPVGSQVARLHAEHDVELRTGVSVTNVTESNGRTTGAVLTDGSVVVADTVLAAIGSEPQTGWLAGSGHDISEGLRCDAYCRAASDVYAAGDVARWSHPMFGAVRVEHRMNATEQGICVARNILGAGEAYSPTLYAWSDQYDTRIQTYGFLGARHDIAIVEGSFEERRFVAVYGMHGRVTGALAWRCPRGLRSARELVVQAAPWNEIRGHYASDQATTDRTRTVSSVASMSTSTSPTPTSAGSRGALL